MCIYIYLEPVCPLFWWLNPPKQGLFQSKQGSFGFQVGIYIINTFLLPCCMLQSCTENAPSKNYTHTSPNQLNQPTRPKQTKHHRRSVTLTETNSSRLKIDPWKRRFLLETTIFRCELAVSFRERGKNPIPCHRQTRRFQETRIDWNCVRPHGWRALAACHGSSRISTSDRWMDIDGWRMDGEHVVSIGFQLDETGDDFMWFFLDGWKPKKCTWLMRITC